MISSILPVILPTVGKLVDKIFPDEQAAKREKLKIEQELLKQLQSVDLAQIDVNKVEAAGNALQRSWRPTIGWVCALAFAYHFLVQPMIVFIAGISGHPIPLPDFDMSALMSVTIGQSGLKLLVAYESSTQYQPRFDFYGIAERSVRTNVGKEMDKAIARALRSAK